MGKLVKCKGCGAGISKNAKVCPHCGEPAPKKTSLLTWLVLILFIIGIFGGMPDTSSSSSSKTNTAAPAAVTQNEPTQAEIEQKKKAKEQDVEYFKQSKEEIVENLRLEIKNENYGKVAELARKYLQFKGNDKDIIKINQEASILMAKVFKEKQTEKNKKKKEEIVRKLKTIPTSDFNQNKRLYETLLNYEPDNKKYIEKVKFYTDKINKEETKREKKRTDRIAKFGKPPVASAWDGSYSAVERYLEQVANDPDSIKISGCTEVYHSKDGWLVGCDYRGRNAFGGIIRQSNWFTIRHNNVIRMDKASTYSP